MGHTSPTAEDNTFQCFVRHIEIDESGCWLWTAAKHHNGYGNFHVTRKGGRAHRYSYEWFVMSIPKGLVIDHLCRVRHCVNPDHMEVVTQRENLMRGNTDAARKAAQTHCKRGHPFDEENTYRPRNGGRHCRACAKGRAKERIRK